MSSNENKQITKEIILKLIEEEDLIRSEFPEAKTFVDVVCQAYEKILVTVSAKE